MIKTLFIPARVKSRVNSKKITEISKQLPKEIAIAYSIQFEEVAKEIKKELSKKHTITKLVQVLGCSNPVFPKTTKAILLIGSGRFHAVSIAQESKLPTYVLDQNNLHKISGKEVEEIEKKKKVAYLNFLHADEAGILISTKPGQQKLKRAINLKNKIKNKKLYFFLADNINSLELENFKIGSWINTACPRMDMDFNFLNIRDLE